MSSPSPFVDCRQEEATGGRGADAVMEEEGTADTARLALGLTRPGGVVESVGVHTEEHFAFSPAEAYDRSLTWRAAAARRAARSTGCWLKEGRYPFTSIITHC